MTIEKMTDGSLRRFTMVGGYPIFYATKKDEALCAECAADRPDDVERESVNWENESLHCDECSEKIECAYPSDESGKDGR